MNDREMLLLYVTIAFIPHILGFPRKIPIGGLFDNDKIIQKTFELSIKAVNKNISTIKHTRGVLLTPRTEKINKNAFQVANIACELINNKVAGIFGPQDKSTANYVQSMCDTLDIPYITARWDSEPKCSNKKEKVQVEPLNFDDVYGVFLIMISGVALSWIFTCWTFLWNIRNVAIRHNISFKKEFMEELKFLIKFSSKKTVKRRENFVEIKNNSTDSA